MLRPPDPHRPGEQRRDVTSAELLKRCETRHILQRVPLTPPVQRPVTAYRDREERLPRPGRVVPVHDLAGVPSYRQWAAYSIRARFCAAWPTRQSLPGVRPVIVAVIKRVSPAGSRPRKWRYRPRTHVHPRPRGRQSLATCGDTPFNPLATMGGWTGLRRNRDCPPPLAVLYAESRRTSPPTLPTTAERSLGSKARTMINRGL
jgi:hypothetical protein